MTRSRRAPRKPARSPAVAAKPRFRIDGTTAAIVAIAVIVRLPHLGWGLPEVEEEALPMKHAISMWGWERGQLELDPGVAGWPSLSFYLHLALQHLHYVLGRITGAFVNRDDYFVSYWLDRGPVLVLARAASVAATAGIVWCGARLARRLAGAEAAWLAGLLLALSPMLVEHAQLVTPDVWVALFTALAVSRIVDIQQRGALRDYLGAGAWIGLGISSKYTPALLLPAVFVAHVLRTRRALGREPWLALGVAAAVFVLTSPYLLLDLGRTMGQVREQALHMTQGHFGASTRPAAIEYFANVLPGALGWPGFLLALAGLTWACVRERGPWLALAACVVPYYAGLSLLQTQFPRYVLPLLEPIAVGIGGIVLLVRSLPSLAARPARVAAVALVAAAALIPPALVTWRYHQEKARPGAAHLANEMFRTDPALRRAHIASEILGLTLPTARTRHELPEGLVARLTPAQRQRVLARPVFELDLIPMYSVQPEMSAFYYDLRHFRPYDFVVVSQSMRDRYLADSARFSTQVAFYSDLDRHARLVRRFGPGEGARPPEIRVYAMPRDTAWLRAREPVSLDPERIGRVSHIDYMIFVEGVARAALARQDWATAARYYRAMWENASRGGISPEERRALGALVSQLEARLGRSTSD